MICFLLLRRITTRPLSPQETVSQFVTFTGFPFDLAQGGESFDFAQDREPVERPVEPRISPWEAPIVRNDCHLA